MIETFFSWKNILTFTIYTHTFSNGATAAAITPMASLGTQCVADSIAASADSNDYIIVSYKFIVRYWFFNYTFSYRSSLRLFAVLLKKGDWFVKHKHLLFSRVFQICSRPLKLISKLMAATKFSDYLGLNHYKKAKK